ncbi:hypothetical protein EN866_33090 [Mesorhizobium sp. M2D.F.Ca.ET.223.01.1.1]|uniref:hypothetical protein n=1 Tax=Mesorhizobium sp. M2D.F.Ca.ET.223.01.1.1 TaxID=2563940 RepID=UPI001092C037|nr:hypothetical protein [Mesorhizobium sp. M2D.F.Ca.ET.223.01.1.1]TGR84587.1 hypothetical protein EN866_33090 [Mesorhizobium sp. M2D.F.Ca.ET.223.01.1.1]TGT75155.1 hypothetical protein EN802_09120 [bacterium M00.F.Ca.ET.159.01.1.1]TGT88022.1 hypothetical protein EN800_06010 [bacterium M00.F.Ca.ET.157.01.1.1]
MQLASIAVHLKGHPGQMAENEDEAMLSIKVDKRPISQAQLIGFLAMIAVQIFVAGGVWYKFQTLADEAAKKSDLTALTTKVDDQERARDLRSQSIDKTLDDINDKLKPLENVTYRLDQQDKRDDTQDARIDRLLDMMGTKFDALSKDVQDVKTDVAGVKADVRVVAQDVKNLTAKGQPTLFRP